MERRDKTAREKEKHVLVLSDKGHNIKVLRGWVGLTASAPKTDAQYTTL